jgi:putative glutamine amidotransferase
MGALAPLIGVTTSEVRRTVTVHPSPESDPAQPELALGMNYMRAVERAGGIPVVLTPLTSEGAIEALLSRLSGVCLSGGPDLDPAAYGAEPHPELGPTEPELDAFELAVARRADALGLPILGICRGLQTINVARGGTLRQHLPDVTDGSIVHRQTVSGRRTTHSVRVQHNSRLAGVLGALEVGVNSFHHQAIDRLGAGLRAVAWAADGTIEGAEADGPGFLLGVQWHAETLVEASEHLALFEALVAAAVEPTASMTEAAAA